MVNSSGAFEYRRSLSDGPADTESPRDGIPADDGMQALRQQLHQVRLLAVSTEEKARQMHNLMTTHYTKHILAAASPHPDHHHANSNGSKETQVEQELGWEMVQDENPYKVRPGDTDATISPLPSRPAESESALDMDDEEILDDGPALGCRHYKRNVKIQCFDCERWFNCRHCHDAAPDLPFQHTLNRKKTRHMLCMLCGTPQPASDRCISCGEYAAWYYCSKCKLWDNDVNKRIYHCDDCGLCRIGQGLGKDFVHCRRCNVCISIGTSNSHPCIERATDSDCPLCLTYLFESPTPVVSLPCGHYMHGDCYKDLMAVTYKCPVCNKSAVNMELQWRKLDDEIHAQPMPQGDEDLRNLLPHIDEHTLPTTPAATSDNDDDHDAPSTTYGPRTVWIGCNDCGARSSTPFHWLGLKCQICGGYNTNQMAPPADRETETERLLRQQAQHRQHDFTGNYVLHDVGIGREAAAGEQSGGEQGQEEEEQVHQHQEQETTAPRVDSAIDASSPARSPTRPGLFARRASEAHSPSRRYFVQAQEQRRSSSFTAPRFSAPSMPTLPALPNLPRMPDLSSIRDIHLPSLPHLPAMSSIELSRFSPYEMAAVLSRSLSPMRYSRDGSASAGEVPHQRSSNGSPNWRNSAPPETYGRAEADKLDSGERSDRQVRHDTHNQSRPVQVEDTSENDQLRHSRRGDEFKDDDDIFSELIGHP